MSNEPLPAQTALRAWIIDRLKADAKVNARVGDRVHNVAPAADAPKGAKPLLVVQTAARPHNTKTEDGHEHSVRIFVVGDYRGQQEGELILADVKASLEAGFAAGGVAGVTLRGHKLTLLEVGFEDVSPTEEGKAYEGVQDWLALTEVTA